MESRTPFGAWLRQRRKMLDLTQSALAQEVGCSTVTIRKLEAGERKASHELAEILSIHLRIPERERLAFVQFARSGDPDINFHLPAWQSDTPTWRVAQLPTPTMKSDDDPRLLSLRYDIVALEKPEILNIGNGIQLFKIQATGDVTGELEGTLDIQITQIIHPKPEGIGMSQAVPMPLGAFFTITAGTDALAGSYTGTLIPNVDANGNGIARSQGSGHVISVSAHFHTLHLSAVFIEEQIRMVEGLGTGSSGTIMIDPRLK